MNLVNKHSEINEHVVPIGYPVEDMEVLLLNETGQRVAANQVGEIAVRSRYLSPGYWRKPDLTEAAFQPDPAADGQRIYRTGDLGLMMADGCLTHLGRKDFQVNIRGYRVEVGEIEAALVSLDGVEEAVVLAWGDAVAEQQRLVAYLVGQQPRSPSEY